MDRHLGLSAAWVGIIRSPATRLAGEIAVVSESRLKDPEVFAAVHGKRAGFQNPVLPISRIWASQELAYDPQHHDLVVRSALHTRPLS